MPVLNRLSAWLPELTALRRDFHTHPELEFTLPRTSARVAEELRAMGCDRVETGLARSGVVAVIEGRQAPLPGAPRAIGLRADMDALPMQEATGLPYASGTEGQMHGCGHDGHTVMLLGAARYLAETRQFAGRVVLIFQPAEEQGGGAQVMLQEGLLERFPVDEVYALHNMPGLPVGQFSTCPGAIMASVDDVTITVTGKGGHAAYPGDCIDPVLIASQIVTALQSVVARNLDPLLGGVVSITSIAQDALSHNVIPAEIRLLGTIRALDPAARALLLRRVEEVATGTAAMMGGQARVAIDEGYPVTVNDPEATARAVAVAAEVSGAPVNDAIAPSMGAEDFSFLLEARPGAYLLTGNGDSAGLHHPAYDFNDQAIPFGASWFVGMAESRLKGTS